MESIKKPDLILFSSQVLLIFIVVITSLINLSIGCDNPNFWTVVLTSCLGYIMPNPKLKFENNIKESKENVGVGDARRY